MTFNPHDYVINIDRRVKRKDSQGHETWEIIRTEYLPVQHRLYWFRCENQKGKIDSHPVTLDLERGAAIFETYVEREDGGSARMHGSETASDWRDFIEKAQTKSLGRALAAVGYGSQFTDDEFVEGERIVDSPVPVPSPATSRQATSKAKGTLSVVPPATVPTPTSELPPLVAVLHEMYIYARDLGLVTDTVSWEKLKVDIIGEAIHDEQMSVGHVEQMRVGLAQRKKNKKTANSQ